MEDARVTMQLYVQHRREWEKSLREKRHLTSEEKHQRIRARRLKADSSSSFTNKKSVNS